MSSGNGVERPNQEQSVDTVVRTLRELNMVEAFDNREVAAAEARSRNQLVFRESKTFPSEIAVTDPNGNHYVLDKGYLGKNSAAIEGAIARARNLQAATAIPSAVTVTVAAPAPAAAPLSFQFAAAPTDNSSNLDNAAAGCLDEIQKIKKDPKIDQVIANAVEQSYQIILNDVANKTPQEVEASFLTLKSFCESVNKSKGNLIVDEKVVQKVAELSDEGAKSKNQKSYFGHPILCGMGVLAAFALVGGFIALSVMSGGVLPAAMLIGTFTAHVAIPIVAHFFVASVVPFLHTATMAAGAALHGPAMAAVSTLKGAAIFTGKFVVAYPIFVGVVGALASVLTLGAVKAGHGLINAKSAEKGVTAAAPTGAKIPSLQDTVNKGLSRLGVAVGLLPEKVQKERDEQLVRTPENTNKTTGPE